MILLTRSSSSTEIIGAAVPGVQVASNSLEGRTEEGAGLSFASAKRECLSHEG